jgi:hypothetical protein
MININKSYNMEILKKGCVVCEDKNNNIHIFTRNKSFDESNLEGYYRIMIFNNKKSEFVKYIEKEEAESIAVTLFGYRHDVLNSFEQIDKKELEEIYNLNNDVTENYTNNKINKYLKNIDYSLLNKIDFSKITEFLERKSSATSLYQANIIFEKLSKFNLTNIEYLCLFAKTIFGPGHYDNINTIKFSNKNYLSKGTLSLEFIDNIKIK